MRRELAVKALYMYILRRGKREKEGMVMNRDTTLPQYDSARGKWEEM